VGRQLGEQLFDPVIGDDYDLFAIDLRGAFLGRDILNDQAMTHGVPKSFRKDPMDMPNCTRADTAVTVFATTGTQGGGLPALDITRPELLQALGPNMRND
jgi:hypothetical protein